MSAVIFVACFILAMCSCFFLPVAIIAVLCMLASLLCIVRWPNYAVILYPMILFSIAQQNISLILLLIPSNLKQLRK